MDEQKRGSEPSVTRVIDQELKRLESSVDWSVRPEWVDSAIGPIRCSYQTNGLTSYVQLYWKGPGDLQVWQWKRLAA